MLIPRGLLPRWPGFILLSVIFHNEDQLREGDLQVTFLDVGQGLSVLLRSKSQVLLYDTGPKFGSSFSAASQIAVPSIRKTGASMLDYLVISHSDNDHAGGLEDVVHGIIVNKVRGGVSGARRAGL